MISDGIVPTVKHGGRSTMVWRCIGANSVGDLIKIEEILKKEQYLSILRDHAMWEAINRAKFYFHAWQRSQAYCKGFAKTICNIIEQSDESKMTHWPPQSVDLNPIENIWDESDRKIREVRPKSQNDLWNKLQDAWSQIVSEKNRKINKTDGEISRTNN